jgi:hypothetical protein
VLGCVVLCCFSSSINEMMRSSPAYLRKKSYGSFNGFTILAPGSINISDQQNGPFPKA